MSDNPNDIFTYPIEEVVAADDSIVDGTQFLTPEYGVGDQPEADAAKSSRKAKHDE